MDGTQLIRYLMSGAVGLVVNLGSYRLLMTGGLHYLAGSVLAFSLSTGTGFVMQKYWTFAEREHANAPRQFLMYLMNGLFNLGLNTGIVFVVVEFIGLHYLVAQATGAAIVSVWSFFLYRRYIFSRKTYEPRQSTASAAERQS